MTTPQALFILEEYQRRRDHPENHDAYTINEHLETIHHYACQAGFIVEFGSGFCNSTWALLAGMPKKMRCYDVNRWSPYFEQVEAAAIMTGMDFAFIKADTSQVTIDPCDLLFIDSRHTFAHCQAELAHNGSLVGRWIIFHDTTTFGEKGEDSGTGLWPAIEQFIAANPHWKIKERFTHNNGLTVLERI